MKRLPPTVNLRGIDYKVKHVSRIDPTRVQGGEKGDLVWGAFDRLNEAIEIRKDLPHQRKQVIFLHEMLRGLTDDLGFDEDDIDVLSWRLYDALKRNRLKFGNE